MVQVAVSRCPLPCPLHYTPILSDFEVGVWVVLGLAIGLGLMLGLMQLGLLVT